MPQRSLFFAVLALLSASAAGAQMVGQNTGPESGAASGTDGVARITGTRSPWGAPASTNPNATIASQGPHAFLSGNVMFDDGTSPTAGIRIERVCGAGVHLEGQTDSKGRFSFPLGGQVANNIAEADSSNNNLGSARSATDGISESEAGFGGVGSLGLAGCELRASYPGYKSESIDLSTHTSASNLRVGTILLHHMGNVSGTVISATTAQAPRSAQKSFEKGYLLVQEGKLPEAEQKFKAATADYPKFAVAWFALGQLQHRRNKPDEAAKSYSAAIAADPRYVSPYDQLALLAGEQAKWQDAARYSKQAIDLNPIELPSAFWYNALANYNLKNDADAEKSALACIKIDAHHLFPQAQTMRADFAESRGDLAAAATYLQDFLNEAPYAANVDEVRLRLTRLQAKNVATSHP